MGQSRNADLPGRRANGFPRSGAANAICGECRDQKRATRCQPEVERLRDEPVNLKQSIAIQRRQQLLGEQTRALYQDQYLQLGTRPLLDLLNVDQEIYQAQFNQVLTEAQLRNLELDCLFSTGKMRAVFALDNQRIQGVEIRP